MTSPGSTPFATRVAKRIADRALAGQRPVGPPTKADNARLKKVLQSQDAAYLRRWRVGYIGLWLPELHAQDWTVVAAWLSGQDAALRDGRRLTARAAEQRAILERDGYLALARPKPEEPF